jgi:hypothetical protein
LCNHDVCQHGPSIEELRQDLEDWRASAPASPDQNDSSPLSTFGSHGFFQLAYDHSILLLYRHYIMDTKPYKCSPPLPKTPEIVERAFEECYAKAKDLCLLYRRLYQNPSIQFTWGSLHMLFFGGLTYLYCLWKSRSVREGAKQREVLNTSMACQTVLVVIAERCKLATSYRDLFEKLSERTISMMSGDLDPNVHSFDSNTANPAPDVEADILPGQTWTGGVEGLDFPPETEWLVSELVQELQGTQNETFDFIDANQGYDFQLQSFDPVLDWGVNGM